MTKTQIWAGTFLLLFAILLVIGRVLKNDDSEAMNPTSIPTPQQTEGSSDLTGQELYARIGCNSCHGSDLSGTVMAPELKDLDKNWNRDELINYLRNPASYMDKDRLKAYKEKYKGIMPSYNNIDVKDLGKLSDFLLTK